MWVAAFFGLCAGVLLFAVLSVVTTYHGGGYAEGAEPRQRATLRVGGVPKSRCLLGSGAASSRFSGHPRSRRHAVDNALRLIGVVPRCIDGFWSRA